MNYGRTRRQKNCIQNHNFTWLRFLQSTYTTRKHENVKSSLMVKRKSLNGDEPLFKEEQSAKRQKFENPIEEIHSARQLRAVLVFQQDAITQLREGPS